MKVKIFKIFYKKIRRVKPSSYFAIASRQLHKNTVRLLAVEKCDDALR